MGYLRKVWVMLLLGPTVMDTTLFYLVKCIICLVLIEFFSKQMFLELELIEHLTRKSSDWWVWINDKYGKGHQVNQPMDYHIIHAQVRL